jgi:hypothetical protein
MVKQVRTFGLVILLSLALSGCTSAQDKQFTFTLGGTFYRMTDCYVGLAVVNYGQYNKSKVNVLTIKLNTDPLDKGRADIFVDSTIKLTNASKQTYQYNDPRVSTNNKDEVLVKFITPAGGSENLIHWFVQGNDITMVC